MSEELHQDGMPPSLTIRDAVASICLRRPKKMNRLTADDLALLQAHCEQIDADKGIRVVVLTADTAGQRHPVFCAGYDVGAFDSKTHDPQLFEQTVDRLAALKPILVCGLNGSVFGGATDMVLACDLRIGQFGMVFKMPAVALGLHYYPSGLRRYVQAFGLERAKQAFLSARPFSSEQLLACGILMDIHDHQAFDAALEKLTFEICDLAPLAAQSTKRSLAEIANGLFDLNSLRAREAVSIHSNDFVEGRAAFAQRRTPQFKGN